MVGNEVAHIIGLTEQQWCLLQEPLRALSPGLDVYLGGERGRSQMGGDRTARRPPGEPPVASYARAGRIAGPTPKDPEHRSDRARR